MTGLLRRIRRRGAADESRTDETASSEPAAAPIEPSSTDGASAAAQPAGESPAAALPAGVDPEELARRPSSRRRGSLRRRLRYLQRAREVMLRDLGGLVYEIRRREPGSAEGLVDAKVQRLVAVDAELRELEGALGPRGETVLREPGIGGSCPACGELHPSDARFCARCGQELTVQETAAKAVEPAPAATAVEPEPAATAVEPAPAADPEAPTREQAAAANGRLAGTPAGSEPAPTTASDHS
jgi:hypothetical protein